MKPTIHASLSALALCLALLCAPFLAAAQGDGEVPFSEVDPQLALARMLYEPANWPQGALRAGFALGELELDGFVREALEPRGDEVLARYAPSDERHSSGFLIEMLVASDLDGAREKLLSWLASVSSPDPLPRASELGIAVGEIGFVGRSPHGEEFPHWIAFVRGNVALRLAARDLDHEARPSLAALARRVDAFARASRALGEGERVPEPSVAKLEVERARLRAGQRTRIALELADGAGGRALPSFVLGGPATGYVQRAADGGFELFTTGPGALELIVEALGSNGRIARRSLHLLVDPE